MKNFNTNTQNNDTWLTPPELIRALGHFNLDPCSPIERPWPTADQHYTIIDNGLAQNWGGGDQNRVWLNPPYGKETFQWMRKLSEHKNGIALIFARTETKGFHTEIWGKAHSVFFFKGRLSFYTVEGNKGKPCNAPSCLISYSEQDTKAIRQAEHNGQIKGKLVTLCE